MTIQTGILIGIDLGTTALKAAAFDAATGEALARASQRLAVRIEPDGTREQDAATLRSALSGVACELRNTLGERWPEVAGIGLCAQGGSGMIVDRVSGAPHTGMMLWNDSRCLCEREHVAARKPADEWERLTLRSGPGVGLSRLAWLRKLNPALLAETNMYVGAGEYVYFLLTGSWRQDACNALQIGCYNAPENRLDAELLGAVDLPLSFVAPLRDGHESHPLSPTGRELLGIDIPRPAAQPVAWDCIPRASAAVTAQESRRATPSCFDPAEASIPVVGPYMDHEAGYLSAANISKAPLQCSLGTAWVGNFIVDNIDAGKSPLQLVIGSPLGPGHEVIQPLLTGNVSWDWGLETLVSRDHAVAINALDAIFSEELLPPAGLVALPWLTQADTLVPGSAGAGAFVGVSVHTTQHDMLRALAASMVYEFYRIFRDVAETGMVDSVVLGGGASKGRFFRELLAAMFAPLPMFSLADEDVAGARGAVFAFNPTTATSTGIPVEVPDSKTCDQVRHGYDLYLDLFTRLCGHVPIWGPYKASSPGRPGRGCS